MRTIKIIILNFIIVLGLSLNAHSQTLSRKEKKEVRKAQQEANFYILDSLLNAKSFVLEADYLQNRHGVRIPVSSNLNFIKVDKTQGVLQTGSYFEKGYNMVGGVTAEGNIGRWEVHKNPKKLSHMLRFNLITNRGNFDIVLTVNAENIASATISGYTSGRLTWHGKLNTVGNSRIFKGQI